MAAIFLRVGYAGSAALGDQVGKAGDVAVAALRAVRIEGAASDLFGEEGADFLAQLFAFGRKADGIETEGCGHFRTCPECRYFLQSKSSTVAAPKVRPLSHGERAGVRGYGLSMGRNPSPGSQLSMRAARSLCDRAPKPGGAHSRC